MRQIFEKLVIKMGNDFSISVSGKSSSLKHTFQQERILDGNFEMALTLIQTVFSICVNPIIHFIMAMKR